MSIFSVHAGETKFLNVCPPSPANHPLLRSRMKTFRTPPLCAQTLPVISRSPACAPEALAAAREAGDAGEAGEADAPLPSAPFLVALVSPGAWFAPLSLSLREDPNYVLSSSNQKICSLTVRIGKQVIKICFSVGNCDYLL